MESIVNIDHIHDNANAPAIVECITERIKYNISYWTYYHLNIQFLTIATQTTRYLMGDPAIYVLVFKILDKFNDLIYDCLYSLTNCLFAILYLYCGIIGIITSCISPSNGILLHHNSNHYGSTIYIQSKKLLWDTSTCIIDITLDLNINYIIWLTPNNNGNNNMYWMGDNNNLNNSSLLYSLTNDVLNIINMSSTVTLYLGSDINFKSTSQINSSL